MYLIGVDIGGSHVGIGLIDADTLVMRDSVTTKINGNDILAAELVQVIVDGCHSLLKQAKITVENIHLEIEAVGMGCPGQVHNNVLITAVNFPKLADCPLAQLVCKALGGKVFTKLINDADAAMCAEIWGNPAVYGKYQHIAMVTLGTGVGFGLILNGQLHQGASGLIEGGHMIVTSNSTETAYSLSSKPKTPSSASTSSSNIASAVGGLAHARLCGCGQVGCVETVASAKNTVQRLIDADAQESQSQSQQQATPQVDGKILFERYAMNDFNAVKVVEETGEYLALMVINVCRVVDPEIIVFGGGLSKAGKPLLDVIKKHVKQRTWKLPTDVKLTLALTDENGVIGAALAAKNDTSRVLATPSSALVSDVTHPVEHKETHSHHQPPSLQPPQSSRKTPSSSSSSSSQSAASGTHLSLWVGAFLAVSSTALFALDVFGVHKAEKGSSSSSSSAGVVAWVTRGLLAGQMAVGAYVLQQSLLSQSHVKDN